jgi:hypothetical protein
MSHHHEQAHHHSTKPSNSKLHSMINPDTQEGAIQSASQKLKVQPQPQNPKIESKSHPCILIRRAARAVVRHHLKITNIDLAGRWRGC